ncbi:MAG: flagellar basal-body rod protein FlgG [Phycisphaerae bacterium]
MLRAFSSAATGMAAQDQIVGVISNNLANINTNGFKRSQVDFQDLMYVKLLEAGREVADGQKAPTGLEIGNGVRTAATMKVFSQGEARATNRPLDMSIEGEGFFEVTTPSGDSRYTRDGSFRMNAEGKLVTASGYYLSPEITIPADARSISVGDDGTVSVLQGNGNSNTVVGKVSLVRFVNPSGLSSEGQNLFAETGASGTPTTGTAGVDGFGIVRQGYLEKSNVQMVSELVNLITAQRAYEVNAKAIQAGDEMLTTANRLIS